MKLTEEQVLEIVQKHTINENVTITRDVKVEDSGIDSYGLIEVIFELEDQLGIDIPFNANDGTFNDAKNVGDLIDDVMALIDKA